MFNAQTAPFKAACGREAETAPRVMSSGVAIKTEEGETLVLSSIDGVTITLAHHDSDGKTALAEIERKELEGLVKQNELVVQVLCKSRPVPVKRKRLAGALKQVGRR